ncbi:MAG: hypothetical protein Q4F95_04275 [Oscillospiraceae bacterium]|nr:hypothetical protein [Oscillospiraceae bacterium]
MRKYLTAYLNYIDQTLASGTVDNLDELKNEHLRQIQFMQHERLIHFLVTFMFAVILFICIGLFCTTENIAFFALIVLTIGLIIPYIWHYYFLENSVQKMYRQYNKICTLQKDCAINNLPVKDLT